MLPQAQELLLLARRGLLVLPLDVVSLLLEELTLAVDSRGDFFALGRLLLAERRQKLLPSLERVLLPVLDVQPLVVVLQGLDQTYLGDTLDIVLRPLLDRRDLLVAVRRRVDQACHQPRPHFFLFASK